MTINDWVRDIHALAVNKGWWDGVEIPTADQILSKLMLVVSELSEAAERVRAPNFEPTEFWRIAHEGGKPDGFGVELADAAIRLMDLCGKLGIDLEQCVRDKHGFNGTRAHRHGGKRA